MKEQETVMDNGQETIINLPKLSRALRRKYLVQKEDKFSTRVLKLISQK